MAYLNYAQTDPRWAGQRLGTIDGVTIGQAGCYVTAFANVAEHFGKDVTPADLDNVFTDRGLYVDGGLCTDDMLTKVYPDIQYQDTYHCEDAPCDLSVFNDFNSYDHEAIVELDASPVPGIQTHFCRFFDYNNGVVRIVDSEDGQIVSVADRYGDPATVIQKVVKYVGPALVVAAPAPAPDPAPEPQSEPQPVPVAVVSEPPAEQPQPTPAPSTPPEPVLDPLSGPAQPQPVNVGDSSSGVPLNGTNDTANSGLRLPSRDSATGRGIATFLQTVVAEMFLVANSGDFKILVVHYMPWLLPALPFLTGLVTFINNALRNEVKNY